MDFEKMTKEELIDYIKNLDEYQSGKYGLVWDKESEPEKVVVDCNYKIPVLKSIPEKDINNTKGINNIIIQGDNYHVLNTLYYTHPNAIDLIYIDPPYNTGNKKEWKYNDKYVDSKDRYKHSKWLNMMQKRLKIACELLKPDGTMFISIDYHEVAQLKLLCDSIFSPNNFLSLISVVNNLKGRSDDEFFATCNEYLLVYAKDKEQCAINGISLTDEEIENEYKLSDEYGSYKLTGLRKTGKGWKREDRPFMYYPILKKNNKFSTITKNEYKKIYNIKTKQFNDKFVKTLEEKYTKKGYEFFLPIDKENRHGRWRWGIDTFIKEKDRNVECNSSNTPCAKMRIALEDGGERLKTNKTTWYKSEYDTGSAGNYLTTVLGEKNKFDNPKSVKYIMDIINLRKEKDITVLDFFAGSGTTGDAVMKLNKLDGGTRRFILCTNNEVGEKQEKEFREKYKLTESKFKNFKETDNQKWKKWEEKNGICSTITYPRLKNVINGYSYKGIKYEGTKENLKYYTTDFVNNTNNRDQLKFDLTEKCIPMLCVKEDTYNLEEKTEDYFIFSNNDKTNYTCIFFNLFSDYEEFINKIKNISSHKSIYVFSLGEEVDDSLFRELKNYSIEPIPYKILEVYKRFIKLSKEKEG